MKKPSDLKGIICLAGKKGNEEDISPKKEAREILSSFYAKHPVKRFDRWSPDKPKGDDNYNFGGHFSDGQQEFNILLKLRKERIEKLVIEKNENPR